MIYLDIRGSTALMDAMTSDAELLHLARCWQVLRDRLLQPRAGGGSVYLANRIGDACLLFCFAMGPRDLFRYLTVELQLLFQEFCDALGELPGAAPRLSPADLKLSVVGGGCDYYETERVPDGLLGHRSCARRDFLGPSINKLARLDALPEAEEYVFLCNAAVRDELAATPEVDASLLVDLGLRELRGFKEPERVFGYGRR